MWLPCTAWNLTLAMAAAAAGTAESACEEEATAPAPEAKVEFLRRFRSVAFFFKERVRVQSKRLQVPKTV